MALVDDHDDKTSHDCIVDIRALCLFLARFAKAIDPHINVLESLDIIQTYVDRHGLELEYVEEIATHIKLTVGMKSELVQ